MGRPTKQKPGDMAVILEEISEGKSHREIAKRLGISHGGLCGWLNAPEVAEQSARAMLNSAEAWLDRGLQELLDSDESTVQRARYIAQECARRAGIRNMHYRERMGIDTNHTGTVTVAITELSNDDLLAIAGGRTIEQASGSQRVIGVHPILAPGLPASETSPDDL